MIVLVSMIVLVKVKDGPFPHNLEIAGSNPLQLSFFRTLYLYRLLSLLIGNFAKRDVVWRKYENENCAATLITGSL